MIAFVLTLLYVASTLLSPAVLPDAVIALHVADILGALTIFACVFSLPGTRLGTSLETYFALGLLAATCFSAFAMGLNGVVDTLLGFLPIISCFFFVLITARSLARLRVLTGMMAVIAVFIILKGLQAEAAGDLLSPYLEAERVTDVVLYRYRGLGVLNDPNDFASFLVMVIPLLWLRWQKGKMLGNVAFTLVPAAMLLFGVYLTHSRGAIIALVLLVLYGFKDKIGLLRSGLMAGALLLAVTVIDVSGGRGLNDDDGGRIAAWGLGLQLTLSHPLFGIGVGKFPEYNPTYLTAHNSYILGLAEIGFFGYFFWIGMLVAGWMGLSLLIAKVKKEKVDARPGVFNPLTSARAQVAVAAGPAEPVAPTAVRPWERVEKNVVLETDEVVAGVARVMQISLVGLLVTSFFLSRTYTVPLYVLLGMSVALRGVSADPLRVEPRVLLKRTAYAVMGSFLFLYLFIRLRGISS